MNGQPEMQISACNSTRGYSSLPDTAIAQDFRCVRRWPAIAPLMFERLYHWFDVICDFEQSGSSCPIGQPAGGGQGGNNGRYHPPCTSEHKETPRLDQLQKQRKLLASLRSEIQFVMI
jgi:hypothetical protein